ncbi:hypothetical protein [Burkholderia glumae]|uniref:hypothetical protein n=1 Tax=Burkholderia glumae TaxID=337 RepID=UPI00214FDD70|nr:hypothetical protein [Burkholderia glumae]
MNRLRTTARNVAQLVALWLGITAALGLLLFLWLVLPNLGVSHEAAPQLIQPTSAKVA